MWWLVKRNWFGLALKNGLVPHAPRGFRRRVVRPPWCPGQTVPHVCCCGVLVIYEPQAPDANGATRAADAVDPAAPISPNNGQDHARAKIHTGEIKKALPPEWYRGAAPEAVGFWFKLIGKLGREKAYAVARDALRHGFTLPKLHAYCRARGLT